MAIPPHARTWPSSRARMARALHACRYGELGYLSHVLFDYTAEEEATWAPAIKLHGPSRADGDDGGGDGGGGGKGAISPPSSAVCILVDGIARAARRAPPLTFADLPLDAAEGYHTVELYSFTRFGDAPTAVSLRRRVRDTGGEDEQMKVIGATQLCATPGE